MKKKTYSGIISIIFFSVAVFSFPSLSSASLVNKTISQTLTSGLVGHWTMDGKDSVWTSSTAGTVVDKSGNGNTGTLTNMAIATAPVVGKIGQAMKFDGSDDYVNAGTGSSLDITGTAITMSAWIYPTGWGGGSFGRIIDKNNLSGSGYIWYLNNFSATAALGFAINDVINVYVFSGNNVISLNKWQHVAVVYNGSGNATFYVNGVSAGIGLNTISGSISSSAAPFSIGARSMDSNRQFAGKIDDVRVYNRALSATEVSQLYSLGAASKANATPKLPLTSGLVSHWTMDGKDTIWTSSTTGTTIDKASNANTGTLTNMNISSALISGKMGQALKFDGTDDRVALGTSLVTPSTSDRTICAWIKRDTGTGGPILWKGIEVAGSMDLGFSVDTSGYLNYREIPTGGRSHRNNVLTVSANVWTHVCTSRTFTATVPRFFINSVEDTSLTITDNNASYYNNTGTAQQLFIGSNTALASFFSGSIDDVRIYSRVLSETEIKQLYSLGAASKVNATPTQPLTSGLVGHWTMDGKDSVWTSSTAGTVIDKSGNGNTGTLTNMAIATAPALGKIGQAIKFDGTNDIVDIGTGLAQSGSYTVSAWVSVSSVPVAAPVIFSRANGNTTYQQNWLLNVDQATSKFNFQFTQAPNFLTYTAVKSNSTYTANKWTFVTAVYNQSTNEALIYINGVYENKTTGAVTPDTTGTQRVNIGNYNNNSDSSTFDGKIDDVRLYNRALSATEIEQLYNMGR